MLKRVTPVLLGLAFLFLGCRTFVPRTKMNFPEKHPEAPTSADEEVYGQVPISCGRQAARLCGRSTPAPSVP